MIRKTSKSNHHTVSELNITPLLDLAFVLLVIFVLTTAPPSTEKPMELPKAATRKKEPDAKVHYVTVDAYGNVFLNRKETNPVALTSELVELRKDDPDLKVTVRGDAKAPFKKVREALNAVQRAKVFKVKLATEALVGS